MKLVQFEGQNIVIAENQPEYLPMPAHIANDAEGTVTCCWELTDDEVKQLIESKKLYHQILTFKQPLQPQLLMVEKPSLV